MPMSAYIFFMGVILNYFSMYHRINKSMLSFIKLTGRPTVTLHGMSSVPTCNLSMQKKKIPTRGKHH